MNPTQGPSHGSPHAPSHSAPHAPHAPAHGTASTNPVQRQVSAKVTGVLNAPPPTYDPHDDPIDLVEEAPPITATKSMIQPLSKIRVEGHGNQQKTFNRKTDVTGHGALRVRSFHGRLSDEGLAYMDSKINEWLDQHPEIEVKQATTCVGEYEGKIREPALIVNIWY